MSLPLSYAAITPARDEVGNLRRLAECLLSQTIRPRVWVVVDGGSSDGSPQLVERLAAEHEFIRLVRNPLDGEPLRGGPIVRAFIAAYSALGDVPNVVVKLDADVSMAPDYFERLVAAFAADPRLGIASGSAYEHHGGIWRQRHMTRASVWGACRAYRRECLEDVLPLEERMGWDSVDEFRANVRGWKTRTLLDLPFRHHRREGERDGPRRVAWATQGTVAHYLGYRVWYLALRAIYQSFRDPAALALLSGYISAAARREPRCADVDARAYLRRQQALRRLPLRIGEALGLRTLIRR